MALSPDLDFDDGRGSGVTEEVGKGGGRLKEVDREEEEEEGKEET